MVLARLLEQPSNTIPATTESLLNDNSEGFLYNPSLR